MYSVDQLTDALKHIDKEKFPDRVADIEKYLKNPGPRGSIVNDMRIGVSDRSNRFFQYIGIELVFWFVVLVLCVVGTLAL